MTASACVAIDVGGTKVDVARVTTDGYIHERVRIDTRAAGDELFERIVEAVSSLEAGRTELIGVGCGGPMRQGGVEVSPLNIPQWRNFPLLDALNAATGAAVFIDNDAKALALAEGRFGAARGLENFVSMVVSTGIGGGIVLDGRLLDGADGNAGHIGHIVVEPNGRRCECGVQGCLEAEASGTALRSILGADPASADEALRTRTGTMVGRAVAAVTSLLDVTDFFVAGSVALGYGDTFFAAANQAAQDLTGLSFAKRVQIHRSQLEKDGPILGAACVAWRSVGI